jgi:hypothetical protein
MAGDVGKTGERLDPVGIENAGSAAQSAMVKAAPAAQPPAFIWSSRMA